MDRRTDGHPAGWTAGRTDEWKDGRTDRDCPNDDPTRRTVRIWLGEALKRCWALILRLPTSINSIVDDFKIHFRGGRDDFQTILATHFEAA